QAVALGMTELKGGALFNAEFGIRHRGSTVPEWSGVALSFCRRPAIYLKGIELYRRVTSIDYAIAIHLAG
ncbi:MAG: hypothetical protein ACREXR_01050, partial [Gammaproteobacteria bacterium]